MANKKSPAVRQGLSWNEQFPPRGFAPAGVISPKGRFLGDPIPTDCFRYYPRLESR
jgi:hypothetical protein